MPLAVLTAANGSNTELLLETLLLVRNGPASTILRKTVDPVLSEFLGKGFLSRERFAFVRVDRP
jgi:hypothetical protein